MKVFSDTEPTLNAERVFVAAGVSSLAPHNLRNMKGVLLLRWTIMAREGSHSNHQCLIGKGALLEKVQVWIDFI